MEPEVWIGKERNRRTLFVDLSNSLISASLSNPDCCRIVFNKVSENELNEVVLIKKFNTILSSDYVKLIKDYTSKVKDEKYYPDPIGNLLKNKVGEETELAKLVKKEVKESTFAKDIYEIIFKPETAPVFIDSRIGLEETNGKILDKYMIGSCEITIRNGKYSVKPREANLSFEEVKELSEIFEKITSSEISEEFTDTVSARNKIHYLIKKELENTQNTQEKEEILARYSYGYGVLELLFMDNKIQDIYVDSPGDKPVYIYHSDYGECETNITISEKDIDKIATKLRSVSGRPFDQANPVINASIEEYSIRVCGITEPVTFNGTAFAFRKHKVQPWTLAEFVHNKMISKDAAKLLNFLVNGEASILVTGPRGSGKTSFLSALLGEVEKKNRIIAIEDTPELPIQELKKQGFNIQHIRTNTEKGYEISARSALRTALRLGESVLVIGEVRGPEVRALFEAMRIGATGNCVMGTIHGSSPYDTWDRVVNDLGVPPTSFKATDVVVSCAPIRSIKNSKKMRRIVKISEVLKNWTKEPLFLDLAVYNRSKDKLELRRENMRKSELMKRMKY